MSFLMYDDMGVRRFVSFPCLFRSPQSPSPHAMLADHIANRPFATVGHVTCFSRTH